MSDGSARVDFYQLTRDPVERVVPLLTRKVRAQNERLLVVAKGEELRQSLSRALWDADGFLAHGPLDAAHSKRQPILLAERCVAPNGATFAILADGVWREEAVQFARTMLLFGQQQTDEARALWQALGARSAIERHIFKQTLAGGWREGA